MDMETVRKVAKLARLDFSETDLAQMTQQLSSILGYIDQLSELNTDGVEPLSHPLPIQNVFREDEAKPSLPVDLALQNAPSRRGDYFSVPAVFDVDEDLSH